MNVLVQVLTPEFLILLTIKITILLGATWLAASSLRSQSAALRHRVWGLGGLAALALPVLMTSLPAIHAEVLGNVVTNVTAVSGTEPDGVPAASASASPANSSVVWFRSSADWAFTLWAGGALWVLLSLFVGLARLSWASRRSEPLLDEDWLRLAAELSESLGLRRPVRLLQCSDAAAMPLTWGSMRPRVLLPDGATEWPEERRRIVLSHELAHIRRQDWLVQMGAELMRGLYWFHPLTWIAASRLRQESERACDDIVLKSGIDASTYAGEIVALAQGLKSRGYRFSTSLAIARQTNLERRFASMLKTSLNREPLSMKAAAIALVCCLSLLLPVAVVRLSAQGPAGDFTGTIRDAGGGAVANGSVTVTNQAVGTIDGTSSDAEGNFRFTGLPAGAYEVRIEKAGFGAYTAAVTLEAGRPQAVNAVLHVETAMQHVTITSNSPAKAPRAATVMPSGGSIGEPRILSRKNPIYPEALRTAGVEGDVILRAIIGKDGNLLSVRVVNTQIDAQLAKAAVEAVNQWRYSPAQLNGVPVETDTVITVAFRLQNPIDAVKN